MTPNPGRRHVEPTWRNNSFDIFSSQLGLMLCNHIYRIRDTPNCSLLNFSLHEELFGRKY